MSGKKDSNADNGRVIQALRGGRALPQGMVRELMTDMRNDRVAQLEKRSSAVRRMSGHLGRARGGDAGEGDGARMERARDSLLRTHQKLAARKLALPAVADAIGGSLPGQISVTVAPPFDYDVVIPGMLAGNKPELKGESDKVTGKMSLSAVTNTRRGFNGGSMYTTVGVYFHPLTRGRLTLYAAPRYSFQWWTNSLNNTDIVRSFGQLGLTIYGVDVASEITGGLAPIKASAGNSFFMWDEQQAGEVHLDFGANVQAPVLSAELNVNHNLVYLLFVAADVHVEGIGWPGSLAGSVLSVSVPWLRYDFRAHDVVDPF